MKRNKFYWLIRIVSILIFTLTACWSPPPRDEDPTPIPLGYLNGTVVDANGETVEGIEVKLTTDTGEEFTTITNNEGYYEVELDFGVYNLFISEQWLREVSIISDEITTANIELPDSNVIRDAQEAFSGASKHSLNFFTSDVETSESCEIPANASEIATHAGKVTHFQFRNGNLVIDLEDNDLWSTVEGIHLLDPVANTFVIDLLDYSTGEEMDVGPIGIVTCDGEIKSYRLPVTSETSQALYCAFTHGTLTGPPPHTVEFTATDNGENAEYHWVFSDNQVFTARDISVTFSDVGTYTYDLTISRGEQSVTCDHIIGDFHHFVSVAPPTATPSPLQLLIAEQLNSPDKYFGGPEHVLLRESTYAVNCDTINYPEWDGVVLFGTTHIETVDQIRQLERDGNITTIHPSTLAVDHDEVDFGNIYSYWLVELSLDAEVVVELAACEAGQDFLYRIFEPFRNNGWAFDDWTINPDSCGNNSDFQITEVLEPIILKFYDDRIFEIRLQSDGSALITGDNNLNGQKLWLNQQLYITTDSQLDGWTNRSIWIENCEDGLAFKVRGGQQQ